ncbi:MAG: hypothetical protein ICV79_23935 [Flavisolibacter sp.]|nr:hypothetical protein [Flavisolibacter sp.]
MKRILMMAAMVFVLQACNNNPGESGAVNDGMKAIDTNGGLADTGHYNVNPSTDTSKMENRVDIQQRDTFRK